MAARNPTTLDGAPVRVKVCGLTRLEDALLAMEAGAYALGFIFYPPSPRFIEPEAAAVITRQLPPFITRVGVFVNESAERINEITTRCGLDRVQLHGDEPPEMLEKINRPGYRVLRLKDEADLEAARKSEEPTMMLDTYDPEHYGGTGRPANWKWARELGAHHRVILAGGITPQNVAQAVQQVQPWAVDVSSGLEAAPGIKDPDKIQALFSALNSAQ